MTSNKRQPESKEDEGVVLQSQKTADQCHTCGQFVDESALHVCKDSAAAQVYDARLGTVVAGHYEILSRIGEGGMSVVYKARHQLLNKIVAVKVLKPILATDHLKLARFKQEALSVNHLDHPNIIRVLHFEIPPNSEPFIIMDYAEGVPLSDILAQEKTLDLDRTIDIFSQICDALSHAHAEGVVHRDIKPNNIMICKNDDGTEVVKIVDFGIAKLINPDDGAQNITQTGEVFGSPLYMSPEQCMGKPLDARSDVYATGCVLYEALSGRPPLCGATALDTIQQHVYQVPQGLSKVKPDLPKALHLEAILFRALAKNPNTRYQMIQELKEALQALDEPKSESVISDAKARLEVYRRRHEAKATGVPPWAIALTCTTLALALVSGLLLQQYVRTGGANTWHESIVSAQKAFDTGNFGPAQNLFERSLELAKLDSNYGHEAASLQELIDLSSGQGKDSSKYVSELAGINPNQPEKNNQVLDSLEKALKQPMKDAQTAANLCNSANDEAISQGTLGNYTLAGKLLNASLKLAQRDLPKSSDEELRTYVNLGHLNLLKGNIDDAMKYLSDLKIKANMPTTRTALARCLRNFSAASINQSKWKDGEGYARQALSLFRQQQAPNSREIGDCHRQIAQALYGQERYVEAERDFKLARNIYEGLSSSERSADYSVACKLDLANVYLRHFKDLEKGPDYLDRATRLYTEVLSDMENIDEKSPTEWGHLLKALYGLASFYDSSQQFHLARPLNLRAEAIASRIQDTVDLSEILAQKAKLLWHTGDPQAETAFKRAAYSFGSESLPLALCLQDMGKMYLNNNEPARAEQVLRHAMDIWSKHDKTANREEREATENLLAEALRKQNKTQEAQKIIEGLAPQKDSQRGAP